MDLRELECLVAVADTGAVTRAAAELGLTQPGVSAALRRLEREVGEPLVHRVGRGIGLTAAGRAALGPARAALAASVDVRAAVAALTGLLGGVVRLGHVGSGATTTLLDPLTAFHREHPHVEISLVEDRSDRLLAALAADRLDLAWIALAEALSPGLESRTVSDERLVLGLAPDDPFVTRSEVALAEAVGRRLVAMPVGTGSRTAWDAACREQSLTSRIAWECSAPDLIGRLVLAGHGPAVLAEPLARALGLHVVPLVEPTPRSRLALVWRTGGPHSPAARAFLVAVGRGSGPIDSDTPRHATPHPR